MTHEEVTISLCDENLNINPASVQVALHQVVGLLLDAKSREDRAALNDALNRVVRRAVRMVGMFELERAADSACLSIDVERSEGDGESASDLIRAALSRTGLHPNWERSCRMKQFRRGAPFVNVSMEDTIREERAKPTLNFLDTPLRDVKRLADAGDLDARETMKQAAEVWPQMRAQVQHHVANMGVDGFLRRIHEDFGLTTPEEAAP